MYSWIWTKLPGPVPVKFVIALLAIAAVIVLLMEIVFPIISPMMPYNDVSV